MSQKGQNLKGRAALPPPSAELKNKAAFCVQHSSCLAIRLFSRGVANDVVQELPVMSPIATSLWRAPKSRQLF